MCIRDSAVAVATANKDNQPNVRMVLLKGLNDKGFVFYTNFNSKKGSEIKENLKASMCFHWKSLRRQVRVIGSVEEVTKEEADVYYNSRPYKNKIGAWASSQSQPLDQRATFLEKIKEFEKKFSKFIGSNYTVGLNSCTAALHIALAIHKFKKKKTPHVTWK